jgi:hypothetical protein
MKFKVISEFVITHYGWPSLAQLTGRVRDIQPQGIEYRGPSGYRGPLDKTLKHRD